MQLDIYENYNRMLRVLHSEAHQARYQETNDNIAAKLEAKKQSMNHEEGETPSLDDFQDIYVEAKAEERVKYNFELNTKTRTGDINDYLEVRRPFGAAAQ